MAIQLTITKGKGNGKRFYFDKEVVRIGRLPENDLVLYDTGVSRSHCEILVANGGFTLRDAGSSNGTLLNDVLTTEGKLRDGDRIGVGPITFVFSARALSEEERSRQPAQQAVSRPRSARKARELEDDQTSALSVEGMPKSLPSRSDGLNVIRTATGSFVAYQRRVTQRFSGLPRSTRLALIVATALVVGAMVVSAYIVKSTPPPDRSAEIFAVDGSTAKLSFGAGGVDVYTPDRASFRFTYDGGAATVHYAAAGVNGDGEVAILVNGKEVGFVEASPQWTTGLRTALPRKLLAPGANVITFDNVYTPEREEVWGVSQVQVVQKPLLPPDPAKAKELFDLGRGAYDTRSVAPQNLYRSIEYFEQAAALLELADPPPPLAAEIQKALDHSREELDNIHENHLFTARKAQRFGERLQAVETLRALLRYYPDPDERRHKEVKRQIGQLLGEQR